MLFWFMGRVLQSDLSYYLMIIAGMWPVFSPNAGEMTENKDLSGSNRMQELDRFDREILSVLAGAGRMSIADLARRIGLSKSPTQSRLRRLEADGVIAGYRAMIDPVRLGLDHVVFVEVRLKDTREAALAAFNSAVSHIGEIEEAYMIASHFDYLLKIRTRSISAYRTVLAEKISTLPHVASTSTYVAMQAVKDPAAQGWIDPG